LALSQNCPNPFRSSATIAFTMPADGRARIDVFNVNGRRIRTVLDDMCEAGPNEVTWDGCDPSGAELASGVYFYRLETAAGSETKKMLSDKGICPPTFG
jgi:flagellar hook assembly protein FlgD